MSKYLIRSGGLTDIQYYLLKSTKENCVNEMRWIDCTHAHSCFVSLHYNRAFSSIIITAEMINHTLCVNEESRKWRNVVGEDHKIDNMGTWTVSMLWSDEGKASDERNEYTTRSIDQHMENIDKTHNEKYAEQFVHLRRHHHQHLIRTSCSM